MNWRLDRDVYAIVRKLEDEAVGSGRRLTVTTVYDSIKGSNSSLARQKKRPLEESIERVLTKRREELKADGLEDDSEELLESEKPTRSGTEDRDAFLLNRQIAKKWNFSAVSPAATKDTDVEMKNSNGTDQDQGDRRPNGEPKPKRRRAEKAAKEIDRSPPTGISIQDIAGVDATLERLLHCVWMPLRFTSAYAQLGYRFDNAVLLYGPSGCGKTSMAHAVAASVGVAMIPVAAQSLVGGTSGESEKNIRDVFDEAIRLAPCLVFMDEIDSIAGKRDSSQKAMEGRMIAEMVSGMDRIAKSTTDGKNVVILAATNRPDALDPIVRRRFGVEVPIGMPDQEARLQILRSMAKGLPLADDVDFTTLAKMTPGFNGADLKHVVTSAVSAALATKLSAERDKSRVLRPDAFPNASNVGRDWLLLEDYRDDQPGPDGESSLTVTAAHFASGIASTQPASKREGFSTIPDTTWAHVGALQDVRRKLETTIIGPIKAPEIYAQVGIRPAAGILLWGPPGCGKTLVAKAVANESRANFISIKGPELLNKYVGESERAVRELFARARTSAPCVLFFDELDALVPRRDDGLADASARVVNAMLTELDGVGDRSGIYVVGATNRPDMIDPAIRRPGRLGTRVYVGLPSPRDRVDILATLYRNSIRTPPGPELADVALDYRCNGFTGADLGDLMEAAARASLERMSGCGKDVVRIIAREDWEVALQQVKPSVKELDMAKYESLQREGV